ncbi:hypothetical protein [Kutzneria sp. NPDC052558]|uniref:hypothetical protein n=1 Tax=Kutzneria sp. NPDC052558 TaxID=3364121 RepID=UPI0037C7B88E
MKHKGIAVLAPIALATVAALGLGSAAQAAPAAQGDTQLVTADQNGNLLHTIRHADGSWQKMGTIPGYGQIDYVTSAIVGGEENVVVEYQHGQDDIRVDRLVRHTDGTWDYHASLPLIPVYPEPIVATTVNGRLNLVSLTPDGPVTAELGANGTWSAFTSVPLPVNLHLRAIAAVANGNSLRVVGLSGDSNVVSVIDRTATGWSPVNSTVINVGNGNIATQLGAAQVGDTLQVAVVVDSATNPQAVPSIAHATMNKSGNWSTFSGVWTYGRPNQVAMTPANGEMQLAYITETGALYHTIRHADGTWQEPGSVQDAAGGGLVTGPVTIAGV